MLNENGVKEKLDILLRSERWRMFGLDETLESDVSGHIPQRRKKWSEKNSHSHPEMEIVFCLKGDSYFGMGGRCFECSPGCVFVVKPDVPHDFMYPPTSDPLEHIWIRVLGEKVLLAWYAIVNGELQRIHDGLCVLAERDLGVLPSNFGKVGDDTDSEFFAARLRVLLSAVAIKMADWLMQPESSRREYLPDSNNLQQDVVSAICQYIDNTAGRDVTLDFLAHYSGYSKYHLLRIFKRHAGCTVHEYINRARLRRMSKLQGEGKTNKSIASELGFSCSNSYLRWRRQFA